MDYTINGHTHSCHIFYFTLRYLLFTFNVYFLLLYQIHYVVKLSTFFSVYVSLIGMDRL